MIIPRLEFDGRGKLCTTFSAFDSKWICWLSPILSRLRIRFLEVWGRACKGTVNFCMQEEIPDAKDSAADDVFLVKVVGALSGLELDIQCKSKMTILDVKEDVECLWDVPVREQKLIVGETVLLDDAVVSLVLAYGQVACSLIRVEANVFREGERVIAVKDSEYMPWRKAGDQGVVMDADPEQVEVYWIQHGESTPFSVDLPGADPYEVLRVTRAPSRMLRIGDLVVAAKSIATGAMFHPAGSEGRIQSINKAGEIVVSWKNPPNTISNVRSSFYGYDGVLLAVCQVRASGTE